MEARPIFPILTTERLKLVEIQQKHLNDIFLLFGDDKVTQYYNIKTFLKPEDGQILDMTCNRLTGIKGI